MPEVIPADPTDPAWHAARRTFIGASEAAAVLGVSRWATALDVWALKVGLVDPQPDNISMSLGRELEDWIARQWQARTGHQVTNPRTTVRHPDYPHIAAAVDREAVLELGSLVLLECKYVGPNLVDDWTAGVPVYVEVQCQVQMAVTGARRVHVCALLAGRRPEWRTWPIDRDDQAIATIIERLDAFWTGHVMTGIRPPLDGDQTRITGTLNTLHPPPENSSPVRLNSAGLDIIHALRHAKQLRKDLDDDIARAENELRAALGDHTDGYADDNDRPVVTWRPQSRTTWDVRAVLDDPPDPDGPLAHIDPDHLAAARIVLRAVETTTTTRVLRLTPQPKRKDT